MQRVPDAPEFPQATDPMIDSPTDTKTLIAAAELWQRDGGTLRPVSSFYGGCDALRSAADATPPESSAISIAFADGKPLILDELTPLSYLHAEAAGSDGLAAAVILPSYTGSEVSSVLVIYLRASVAGGQGGADAGACAAAELWAGTRGRYELSLDQAWHPGLERFARISQYVNFPMGAGLPGLCWQSGNARIVADVATAKAFLRSSSAEGADGTNNRLSVGLGLPLLRDNALQAVLLLISSHATPLARVHEVWMEDPDRPGTLVRSQGTYGGNAGLAEASTGLTFRHGEHANDGGKGLPGRVWDAAAPSLLGGLDAMADAGFARADAARDAGVTWALAYPVVVNDSVRSVVLLMG